MNITKLLYNRKNFIKSFVFFNIIYFLPIASKLYQPVGYALMAWASILLFEMIFISQKSMRNRNVLFLNIFIFFYILTIILNYKFQFVKNVQNLLFLMISFYIIYDTSSDFKDNRKFVVEVNNIFIFTVLVTNIIALLMFVFNVSYLLPGGIRQGLMENRLFGIYTSPNVGGMFSLISIILILFNVLSKKYFNEYNLSLFRSFLLILVVITNISYISLTVSRGTELSLYAFLFTCSFLLLFNKFNRTNIKKVNTFIFSLFIASLIVFISSVSIKVTRTTLVKYTNYFHNINSEESSQVSSNSEITTIDDKIDIAHRTLPNDVSSGRTRIWKTYLKVYVEKPVFGFGSSIVLNDQLEPILDVDLNNFTKDDLKWLSQTKGYIHNGYIQTLVSSGMIGFIIMAFFIISFFFEIIKSILKLEQGTNKALTIQILLFSTTVGLLVNDLVESHIIFNNRDVVGFAFWWLLGIQYQLNSYSLKENKSVERNIAFVAWTPLHLINIINVMSSSFKNDKCFLYIYDEFNNAKNYKKLISENSYFEKVYLVDPKEKGGTIISNFNVIFNRNQFTVDLEPSIFDVMVTQGGNHFQKIMYGIQKKKNPNLELFYLEDGMITYVADTVFELFNIKKYKAKLMNIVNPYSIMNNIFGKAYVYSPKLIYNSSLFDEIVQLEPIDGPGRTTMFELSKIFNLKNDVQNSKYDDQIIFLDQPFVQAGFEINEVEIFKSLFKKISRKPLVKIHPRTIGVEKYESENFAEIMPWELLQIKFELKNTSVISMSSTAPFTSVLMFKSNRNECRIIFIVDLIINEYPNDYPKSFDRISIFASRFSKEYSNILMPKSFEEFSILLKEE